jgi:glycine cleavage system H lipoate-binding protein
MFPWNYGFVWNAGHVIFLGAFYAVLMTIAVTVANALRRSRRDLRGCKTEAIRWHSDFDELLSRDRVCRHVLTGEFRRRECPNAFDCRHCETHGKLIGKRVGQDSLPAGVEEICGMEFPLDRFYHRGHTWTHREPDGTVTVGLDELGKRLLGSPDAVDLPAPGARVLANGTAFRVQRRNADVRVLSPVDGEVIEVGGPQADWYLKVKPDSNGEQAFGHLLRGREIAPWIMREMERLQLALAAEGAAATLADGGVPVADIAAGCPEVDWSAVCGEMFLEP